MPNEKNQTLTQISLPAFGHPMPRLEKARCRLRVIAKCIVIVPLTMALLGAEIELRLSPQLDVILFAASVWSVWRLLVGRG